MEFILNWPGYDGIPAPAGDIELLADTGNTLVPGESGTVENPCGNYSRKRRTF